MIFKPKWQHRNPEVRKQAIDNLDDPAILNKLAQQDEDPSVRGAAVEKLEDITLLDHIAHHDPDETVRNLAFQHFKQIFFNLPNLTEQLHRLANLTRTDFLAQIALEANTFELRLAAVQKIQQEDVLETIAIQDASSEIRWAAAEKITQKEVLERLSKTARNRDKRVHRLVREKLEALLTASEQPKRIQAECETVCNRLSLLGRSQLWEQDYAEYTVLQKRWQAVSSEAAAAEWRDRYQQASTAFLATYQQYQQTRELLRQQLETSRTVREHICQAGEQLLSEVSNAPRASPEQLHHFQTQLSQFGTQWQQSLSVIDREEEQHWQTRFTALMRNLQFQHAALRDFEKGITQLEEIDSRLKTLQNSSEPLKPQQLKDLEAQWQQIKFSPPVISITEPATGHIENVRGDWGKLLRQKIQSNLDNLQQRLKVQREQRDDTLNKFKQKLVELEADLEKGELKKASPTERSARKLLEHLEKELPVHRYKELEARLQKSISKINELRKWQRWGNEVERENLCQRIEGFLARSPQITRELFQVLKGFQDEWQKLGNIRHDEDEKSKKLKQCFQEAYKEGNQRYRIFLCEQMETLIEQPETTHFESRAAAIKEAQSTWKELGSAGHTQELWERFNQACHGAYAPCQIYFNQQAQARQDHFFQKQALCEQLESYPVDWEHLDDQTWKKLHQFIREHQRQWRSTGPIDRKVKKDIDVRYSEALQNFQTRLNGERQANLEFRQGLIADVISIVGSNNTVLNTAIQQLRKKTIPEPVEELEDLDSLAEPEEIPEDSNTIQPEPVKELEDLDGVAEPEETPEDPNTVQKESVQGEVETKGKKIVQRAEIVSNLEKEVEKLNDSEVGQAITQVRKLQKLWKVTVTNSRKKEGELWKLFREVCDVYFEHRKKQQDAIRKDQQDNLQQKEALCQQMESLAQAIGDEIKTAPDKIHALRKSWGQVGEVPEGKEGGLEKRFERAIRQVDRQIEVQRHSQVELEKRRQLDLLGSKAVIYHRLEQGNVDENLRISLENQWTSLPILEDAALENLAAQRFQRAMALSMSDQSATPMEAIDTRKTLCIRMEILAGIESPREELEARMAYQVARLSEVMSGEKIKDKFIEGQELERSWYLSNAVPLEWTDALEQRFKRAKEALYKNRQSQK